MTDIDEVVFVYEADTARMVKVATGIQDNEYIQIISGLEVGQEIIIGPYSTVSRKLKNGLALERKEEKDEEKDEAKEEEKGVMQVIPEDAGLAVFLRKPEKGKVKTRLAATIGDDAALDIYEQLISTTLGQVARLDIPTYLFYDGGLPDTETRLPGFTYMQQHAGDLGRKMAEALAFVLSRHQKAVIIGSDCPYLTERILRESLSMLDTADIVIGPALDGGYYLMGCKKNHPRLFEGINWSTSSVLQQTMAKVKEENLTYAHLEPLADIDTEEDWNIFRSS